MMAASRLVAAAAAAYLALRLGGGLGYPWQVVLAFLAAALAAAAVREIWTLPPHRLRVWAGDLASALVLAVIMILAVRAFGPGHAPSPLLPALSWPFVDLWRPLRRG